MSEQPSLPIKTARNIALKYGWDQVIIVARKVGEPGREHVITYGFGQANSEAAARAGNAIKHHLMRWPHALFSSALRVVGVGRDNDHPRFLSVALNTVPDDDDIRMVHDMLCPPTHSPAEVDRGA
ncbi:hypothetical protein [Pannonibacter sp. SL95]|uniref:hypothetical protein n=1 Tax=Pannonibacter sp. SL95 TaxID=2995153 RepID=UPI0022751F10|nr:hypothetical protein [Pannonibacter sp. SL95]MCY1704512.1 hypothetical protein [Pannonibacter sp. SL95]MCY1707301.1 hypothetical protein [Pannonibacter sp. SL95]MCY1709026.1 hypothetical protein [Pannonibacter sp. SL95]